MSPLRAVLVASVLMCLPAWVLAQEFPTRPIRVIVGFPAGTSVDIAGRAIAVKMQPGLGQPIVVEDRVGANGIIAAQAVISAAPDGYTLYFGTVIGFNPLLTKTNPVDAGKSFAPVSESGTGPFVLFASGKLPVRSMQDLIAYSKSHPPGKLNFALALPTLEMIAAVLKEGTGITFTTVQYKGAPQIIPALLSGEADLNLNFLGAYGPHIADGTIRALAVTCAKRMPQLPDVPTTDELGIPNLGVACGDSGFWATLGTRREVIQRLSTAAADAVKAADVAEQLRNLGYIPLGTTPDEQRTIFESYVRFWRDAVQKTHFQPQ